MQWAVPEAMALRNSPFVETVWCGFTVAAYVQTPGNNTSLFRYASGSEFVYDVVIRAFSSMQHLQKGEGWSELCQWVVTLAIYY